jgi:ATP-binding cassette subfamily B protein
MFNQFPFVAQHDQMDCGPACLAMVAKAYGKNYPLTYLRDNAYLTREGVSLSGMVEAATLIGFECLSVRMTLKELICEPHIPSILFWNSGHFIVLYDIKKKIFSNQYVFKIADPSGGLLTISQDNFEECWIHGGKKGVVLLLQPGESFYQLTTPKERKESFSFLLKYLAPHKKEVVQLMLGMTAGSLLTLVFPILTQLLIDKGINQKSVDLVFIILLAQIFLFFGNLVIDIVRNWILLYLGARINISIISDFFKKMLKLPMRFFQTKFIGDFYQRIYDHSRIETFLTSQSMTTFFSMINFLIFFIVLSYYDVKILLAYLLLTSIAICWSIVFLKRRAILDYFRFRTNALNQQTVIEMINGIEEVKLNNLENYKREEWEQVQIKLFNVNINVLRLDQFQVMGFDFINQFKNIIVTFIAAREVILNHITLGGMLSIVYIIGQMNSPINQLIAFFRSFQDARLSMNRLTEVQNHDDEERPDQVSVSEINHSLENVDSRGIRIKNVSFKYDGPHSPYVLKDINLFIPEGKTTAIVGGSGSGKTTLMKLLLKFYEPVEGEILLDGQSFSGISPLSWRQVCGVVMQDGFIFSDTIARNIATSDMQIDKEKLNTAIKIAHIEDYIDILPQQSLTKIGASGSGISGGQRQRLLIARAVYKRPRYVFFDEATSSLDTVNEKIIHDNLKVFFNKKTVIIIAHRLSTVKNADQIIVLKDGYIVEQGNHDELIKRKDNYFNLVKNQLEIEISS